MCSRSHVSSGSASRPEHLLDAGVHFLFIDEFAAVSLLDALSDASSKARVVFQQPQRCTLDQLCRVHAFLRGDSGKTCFFFRCESDFHDSSDQAGTLTFEAKIAKMRKLRKYTSLTRFLPSCYCEKLSWAQ